MMYKLENIGFNHWVESQLDAIKMAAHELARVVTVHKDRYMISDGLAVVIAELSGSLLYTAGNSTDLPTVGDWVYADFYDEHTHAIIHGVLPRKTLLKRKTVGKQVDFQLIAANVDVAFIMQSADFNFNLSRLERYLVMVNESGITPVILLSKCDLITQNRIDELVGEISIIAPQVTVLAFSNLSGRNDGAIKGFLRPGLTCCLLGSSGVGKTTLLNSVLGSGKFETRTVSKIKSKGRHTTTGRELTELDNGAMLIDTPGMRELGNMSVDSGINETFSEIKELSRNCKFGNCSHTNEKSCAILVALEEGKLSEQRYKNFMKIKKESEFNEMSYSEKRKKDKDFGKLIKSVLISKNR